MIVIGGFDYIEAFRELARTVGTGDRSEIETSGLE
jgi:hypothetical protein